MECCKDCVKEAEKEYRLTLVNLMFFLACCLYFYALLANLGVFNLEIKVQFFIFLCCYFIIGFSILKAALKGLLKREYFNENSLMSIASIGAFCIGDGGEAVAILLFYKIGEFLEYAIIKKSKKQINTLKDMKIENARILRENKHTIIEPKAVRAGDILVVFAGERILSDGEVVFGDGSVDYSAFNGEMLPKAVGLGDSVLSGGINLSGVLHIKATKDYADCAFSKVLKLILEGSLQKSKSEEFITKFARFYTPIVTLLALCIVVLPTLYFWALGGDFIEILKTWAYRGIIFLVVSCPCALVISIPLTFFAALGKASKSGILIKGSRYLEGLNSVGAVVFDKTGTLTKGELNLKEIHCFNNAFSKDFVLRLAQSLEMHSNHPIAKAILKAQNTHDSLQVESLKEHAGGGISAVYNGDVLALGNARFIQTITNIIPKETQSAKCEIFLSYKAQIVASFVLDDTIKEEANKSIEFLKKRGILVYILSGDRSEVVKEVAQNLGIENYFGDLLPQEKVTCVKEILNRLKGDKKLVFIGDGINDAPSLSLSDIGIAMGKNGSDIALDGADIVIMDDNLQKIPKMLEIAQKTRRILWQNIIFALGVKALIMVFGAFGVANLWIALFGDVGVAFLALLNALRAIR